MTVVVKPSLAGLVALTLAPSSHDMELFYILLPDYAPPWETYDTLSPSLIGRFSDLQDNGLEASTGGGYTAGARYAIGTGHVNFDSAAQVLEIALPSGPTWTDDDLFTIDFRYVAIGGGSLSTETNPVVLSFLDTGTTTSLSAAPLSITATESVTFAGTYPIARWTA